MAGREEAVEASRGRREVPRHGCCLALGGARRGRERAVSARRGGGSWAMVFVEGHVSWALVAAPPRRPSGRGALQLCCSRLSSGGHVGPVCCLI